MSIFILAYRELPTDRFHCTYEVLEVHSGERLSEQLQVHFVELPKLPVRSARPGDEELLEDWGKFLLARSDQELEELAMSNPVMAKAKRALDFLSEQPEVQELARQREMAQHNYISAIREGEARGRAEGKAGALLTLLEARGFRVPHELRTRIEDCTDQAQLDEWIRRAATIGAIDSL